MTNKIKNYFKNPYDCKKCLNLKKHGNKIYINTKGDVYVKKNYKYDKYIYGYNYNSNLFNFNILGIKLKIIDKKCREYVNFIKPINIFYNNLLFLK